MTGLLIVSADDLGLTDGVTRAVLRGHVDGVVTATSLLAVGRAFDGAVQMLADTPTLDVGAHLAIVGEDPPLLSAQEIPTLVDKRGAFPLSYRTVVLRGMSRRLDPDDVRREFRAQLDKIRDAGVRVTHLDTHQHVHLWPAVAAVVAELAAEYHIPAVRTPVSHRVLPVGFGVNALSKRLRRRLNLAGLATTGTYTGLDEAGSFDQARFERSLDNLPVAAAIGTTVEINAHPGEQGDPDLERFGWGYRWADELAMLCSPATRTAVERKGYRLGGFPELAPG